MANERVLVVDDNVANQKLVGFILERRGFVVRHALDAKEALAELAAHPPQLILMDVQLPGMDGLSLTRLLRTRADLKGVVIVALTAYAMAGDERRVLAAGCDGYLSKPIDTQTFADRVAGYLADSQDLRRAALGTPLKQ